MHRNINFFLSRIRHRNGLGDDFVLDDVDIQARERIQNAVKLLRIHFHIAEHLDDFFICQYAFALAGLDQLAHAGFHDFCVGLFHAGLSFRPVMSRES
mgnify:CR=1 FL=1